MTSTAVALIAVATTLVVGCGGDEVGSASKRSAERPSTTTSSVAERPSTTPATSSPASPTVEVLDTGTGERRELRYAFTTGDRWTVTTTTKQSVELAGSPSSEATTATTLVLEVVEASDQLSTIRATYRDVSMQLGDAGSSSDFSTSGMVDALKGKSVTYDIDPTGRISNVDTTQLGSTGVPTADRVMSALKDQITSFAQPLPLEAVGVGARWSATSAFSLGTGSADDRIELTVTYTLSGFDGDGAFFDMAMAGATPAGSAVSADMAGSGRSAWDPGGRTSGTQNVTTTLDSHGTTLRQTVSTETTVG